MIKIAVNGAAGRMGRRIITLADGKDDCKIVCALESKDHPRTGADAGTVAGIDCLNVEISSDLCGDPDVLIDFSNPGACIERAKQCVSAGTALVVGTTGLTEGQQNILTENISQDIPVLIAPNMGLGVNLLFQLARQVAGALGDEYDVEIIEAHHNRKKDAPSGTATKLAENVCDAREWNPKKVMQHGREGLTGQRPRNELGIHSVRGGSIIGEHTVIFAGDGERIELTHRAQSRDLFAKGAIRAAVYLAKQSNGVYDMDDVLIS